MSGRYPPPPRLHPSFPLYSRLTDRKLNAPLILMIRLLVSLLSILITSVMPYMLFFLLGFYLQHAVPRILLGTL